MRDTNPQSSYEKRKSYKIQKSHNQLIVACFESANWTTAQCIGLRLQALDY